MNEADQGHHTTAADLLTQSAATAREADRPRQQAWSQGVLARSLLLPDGWRTPGGPPRRASRWPGASGGTRSCPGPRCCGRSAWPRPGSGPRPPPRPSTRSRWPVSWATRAGGDGRPRGSGCWPCTTVTWPGARKWDRRRPAPVRSGSRTATSGSRPTSAWPNWKRKRAARDRAGTVRAAARLYDLAVRCDLPEFLAWAWCTRPRPGDRGRAALARTAAAGVSNPALQARTELPAAR